MSWFGSLYAENMPHRAIAVYMYLKDRANKDGQCYPAIGTIARDLKLSRSTVQRAIGDLVKSGRLRKEQRWRESGGRSSLMYYLQ
ncbi:MAG: helix-turn-helix domain-containing protein [Clostridia bacterium]|nr:helix-turn-helix domain-containing protein [Clostridia bacterium]